MGIKEASQGILSVYRRVSNFLQASSWKIIRKMQVSLQLKKKVIRLYRVKSIVCNTSVCISRLYGQAKGICFFLEGCFCGCSDKLTIFLHYLTEKRSRTLVITSVACENRGGEKAKRLCIGMLWLVSTTVNL